MSQSNVTIYKKLVNLEQQIQKLKVQAYLNLPKKKRISSAYPWEVINKSLNLTRSKIWKERYAKKIKSLS